MIFSRIKAFFIFSIISFAVQAQSGLNWGLNTPQAIETLPHSKAAIQKSVRKEKTQAITRLEQLSTNDFLLVSGWELAEEPKIISNSQSIFSSEYNTHNWYNATVPGTVLTTLVKEGVYPDPYFGLNNLSIPDSLCRTDWWYRIAFQIPAKQKNKLKWLIFDGINYRAEIWLNGKIIGKIDGAFKHGEYNITDYIRPDGDNILAVHILPPPNPGIPHEESSIAGRGPNGGQLCMDGPTFISSEGWDWMPGIRDRNIGIWQPVHLYFTDVIKISEPRIITALPLLPDTTLANITVKTSISNNSDKVQEVTLSGKIEEIVFEKQIHLLPGEKKHIEFTPTEFKQLQLKNPRLWWPNGYGRPELCRLELNAAVNQQLSDTKIVRFGIREFSYDLSVDMPDKQNVRVEYNPLLAIKDGKPVFDNTEHRDIGGRLHVPKLQANIDPKVLKIIDDKAMLSYLVIKVNGQRIFCRGGNWGMDDAMKRTDREFLEPYIKLHQEANMNMIRNWTGESTEESFFDLCDEYGMLVWNDFWLSTENYNLNPNDYSLFLENAQDVIIRYRNHPSIVLWNPRNEGYAPPALEEELNKYVAFYDGTRLYQPNSRYMNLRPSGPWNFFKDPVEYFTKNAQGFSTELGTPSVPTAETVYSMMAKEDTWPISDVWHYHDLHFGQKEYIFTVDSLYGKSSDLDDFCRKVQFVNYDSHRAMFEAWNSKMWNNTSGLLLWMTHPAWPSMVWQIYSYDGETFGSYYGTKKACEPVHVQCNLDNGKVVVVNTTCQEWKSGKIVFELFDLNGKKIYAKQSIKDITANSLTECFTPEVQANLPEVYLQRVSLTVNKKLVSVNEYWKTSGKDFQLFNTLNKAVLKAKIISDNQIDKVVFELTNNSPVPALGIKLGLRNVQSNKRILPAIFSDGYFTLLPYETRILSVSYKRGERAKISVEGYNAGSQDLIMLK